MRHASPIVNSPGDFVAKREEISLTATSILPWPKCEAPSTNEQRRSVAGYSDLGGSAAIDSPVSPFIKSEVDTSLHINGEVDSSLHISSEVDRSPRISYEVDPSPPVNREVNSSPPFNSEVDSKVDPSPCVNSEVVASPPVNSEVVASPPVNSEVDPSPPVRSEVDTLISRTVWKVRFLNVFCCCYIVL